MRPAVALRDIIGEAAHIFVVAIIPPQRRFNANAVNFLIHGNRRFNNRRFIRVQMANKRFDAALIEQFCDDMVFGALIGEDDPHA